MHPNPSFQKTDQTQVMRFLRDRAFGVLAVSTDGAPHLSHVPFLLSDDGHTLDLHLVRSNPICALAKDGIAVRLDVLGPDGYISPDWYGIDDQVPTWNYVAVHVFGTLKALPIESLEPMLARQSAAYEARLPKTPWTMDKMTDATRARFLRMILPFRLRIDNVTSTFKLGQNKPDVARHTAATALDGSPIGAGTADLARLMTGVPTPD